MKTLLKTEIRFHFRDSLSIHTPFYTVYILSICCTTHTMHCKTHSQITHKYRYTHKFPPKKKEKRKKKKESLSRKDPQTLFTSQYTHEHDEHLTRAYRNVPQFVHVQLPRGFELDTSQHTRRHTEHTKCCLIRAFCMQTHCTDCAQNTRVRLHNSLFTRLTPGLEQAGAELWPPF